MIGFITRSSRTLKLVLSVTYKPTPPPLLPVLGFDSKVYSGMLKMSLLSFIFSHVSDSPTKSNLLSRDLRLGPTFNIFNFFGNTSAIY